MAEAELTLADPERAAQEIESFIRRELEGAGRKVVVVALSGGVDSALIATLAVRALGPERVISHALPDGEISRLEDAQDAAQLARALKIAHREISLAEALRAFRRTFNETGLPGNQLAWGNLKPRLRMIVNYFVANSLDGLVLGTGNKSELLLGYFCYDAQTRVMTPEGPKYYWELQPGSVVFSMDLDSRKVVEVPVESVHVFDYQGELIEIHTSRLDLLVTPNHRLLVLRNHGKGPLAFATAESRLRGGATDLPIPEAWDGTTSVPELIDTARFLSSDKLAWNANPPVQMAIADFLYLMGLFIGDGCSAVGHVTVPVKSRLTARDRQTFRTRDGRYARFPDGPIEVKSYAAPRIYIGAGEGKRSRSPLVEILKRYQIHATQTPTMIAFTNRALSAAFAKCGYGARNKRIPSWVLRFPAQVLSHLYKGLMDSDGRANGQAFYTTSEELAYQMVELCVKLGFHAWVQCHPPRSRRYKGEMIRSGPCFEVRIGRLSRSLTFCRKHMRRVYYIGKVWCPSVPPYENILVERDGKVAFCGNTKYGDGGVDILPIGHLYKTQVRQLARHVGVPARIIDKIPTAGLWAGQTDEGEIGMSYELMDQILHCLHDQSLSVAQTVKILRVEKELVQRLANMMERSEHKRRMPPMLSS